MVEFIPVDLSVHKSILTELNKEYLGWVASEFSDKSNLDIISIMNETVESYAKKTVVEIESYKPPKGICYLVQAEGSVAGMGALRRLHSRIGEIKRMFIRPMFRKKGLGRALLQLLLEKGREFGFSTIRLDTVHFMTAAQKLYQSSGFIEREEYPESEIPSHLRHMWLFFEKTF